MPFRYGCFISYAHATAPLMTEFVTGLEEALRCELEPYVRDPVFIDKDRLRPGFRYNEALGQGICASACWVVVYVPQYWSRDYCKRELRAMLELEERRRKGLGGQFDSHMGMIIPIVLRGELDQLPLGLADSVHCLDFKRFSTASGEFIRNETYMAKIQVVAEHIYEVFRLGADLDHGCDGFVVPELDGYAADSPPPPQAFPGRERLAHSGVGER